MIIFEKIRIKNGIVWEDLELDLENQGTIFLTGSNGSGKSSIGELLTHILFGKTSNGFKGNGIVRPSSNSFLGELYLRINNVSYKIVQEKRNKSSSFKVSIYTKENELDVDYSVEVTPKKSQGSSDEPQKYISTLLDLDMSGFIGVSCLNQESSHILISGTGPQRKEYISSLFDLNKYDKYKKIVDNRFKDISKRKDEIFIKESILVGIEEQILEYPTDLEERKLLLQEQLDTIKNKIDLREEKIKNTELYLRHKETVDIKLKNLDLTIKKVTNDLLDTEKEHLKKARETLQENNSYLVKLQSEQNSANKLKKLLEKQNSYTITIKEAYDNKKEKSEQLELLFSEKDVLLNIGVSLNHFIPLLKERLDLKKELIAVKKEIKSEGFSSYIYSDTLDKIKDIRNELAVIKNLVKSLSKIEGNICPTCHREYEDLDTHLEEKENRVTELEEELELLNSAKLLLAQRDAKVESLALLDNKISEQMPTNIPDSENMTLENWEELLVTKRSEFKEMKEAIIVLESEVNKLSSTITELKFLNEEISSYGTINKDFDYESEIAEIRENIVNTNREITKYVERTSAIKDVLSFKDSYSISNLYTPEKLSKAISVVSKLKNNKEVILQDFGEIGQQIKSLEKLIVRKNEVTDLISDKEEVVENYLVYEALQKAIPKLKERLLHIILMQLQEILPLYTNIMFEEYSDLDFVVSDSESSIDLFKRVYVDDEFYDIPVKGLSTGMKQRLGVSLIWTLHKLLQNSKRVDFLFLDEVDKGLDEDGLNALQKLIEEKQDEVGTLILISHRSGIRDVKVDQYWVASSVDNVTSKLVRKQ